jgi:hypothetical protein
MEAVKQKSEKKLRKKTKKKSLFMQKVLALIGLFSYPLVVRVHLPNVGEESEWKVQPLQNSPCLASKNSLFFPCHEIRRPNPLQWKNPKHQLQG